jgi:hypothetical protein
LASTLFGAVERDRVAALTERLIWGRIRLLSMVVELDVGEDDEQEESWRLARFGSRVPLASVSHSQWFVRSALHFERFPLDIVLSSVFAICIYRRMNCSRNPSDF